MKILDKQGEFKD